MDPRRLRVLPGAPVHDLDDFFTISVLIWSISAFFTISVLIWSISAMADAGSVPDAGISGSVSVGETGGGASPVSSGISRYAGTAVAGAPSSDAVRAVAAGGTAASVDGRRRRNRRDTKMTTTITARAITT